MGEKNIMETIFVAGSYGVGKSTLCSEMSKLANIPFFSAGELIGKSIGENYSVNKRVKNVSDNQAILKNQVERLLSEYGRIILAGHFCVFDNNGDVCLINTDSFIYLHISKILLLEATPSVIYEHLLIRDKCKYDINQINDLLISERSQADNISKILNVDVIYYRMNYDGKDVDKCLKQLFNDIDQ